MDGTAFAYAGLTGNALIDQLGTDVSRRLLAFEARGAVEHRRGRLRVLSREALAAAACSCRAPLNEEARWLERVAT